MSRERTFLSCAWRNLVSLSWEIDAAAVAALVPVGLELDFLDGRTFVSLVGFQFLDTRALGVPLPFQQRFEEVNLRIYVRRRAEEGWRHGVVFLKEIVPRWPIAAGARWLFNEPYCTMPMRHDVARLEASGGTLAYEWRWQDRWHRVSAQVGDRLGPPEAGTPYEFLVERHWGYTRQRNGATVEYRVRRPAWTLWAAREPRIDLDTAGLYGSRLAPFLAQPPATAVIADGSAVTVSWGTRLRA